MTRALEITDSQRQSSDRHNLHAAIYLLSGTFVGRSGIPDAPFYWSTQEVTAFGQLFKPYIAPPQSILRGMGFEPGAEGSFPEVRIPVRNLPFAHSESIVAAVTDEDFRIENATATLRVAYLRPGQTPGDLASGDWTPLVLNGFLGPADEVTLDGLVLPLYNRGARRNQSMVWPRLPSPETMSGGAIDSDDAGTIPPIVVGHPRDWFIVPTLNLGVRGFTSSGFDAGQTAITFRAITVGNENLASGNVSGGANVAYGLGSAMMSIHYSFPVYTISSAEYDVNTKEFTVHLASGLAADIPRGAYVQQFGPGFNPATGVPTNHPTYVAGTFYMWALGAPVNFTHIQAGPEFSARDYRFGWLFPDGEVRPADEDTWSIGLESVPFSLSGDGGTNMGGIDSDFTGGQLIVLSRGTPSFPFVPVYYDPLANVPQDVAQQPEFSNQVTAFNVLNYGTGGSHTGTGPNDFANLFDGSDDTSCHVDPNNSYTETFPSAPTPFVNTSTTSSVLHVKSRQTSGTGVKITDGAALTFFTVPGGLNAEVHEFTVAQASPRTFNRTLSFFANDGSSGGFIVECWWEHSLSATVSATRTVDVQLTSGSVPLGPVMQFADLVMSAPDRGGALPALMVSGGTVTDASTFIVPEEINVSGSLASGQDIQALPYPSSVMVGLHALLGTVEGDFFETINSGSYRTAHDRYVQDNIRLGFVWNENNHPADWTELERTVGEQSRSFMFYGPSGHELLYLEASSGFAALPIIQSFRLPGCPGANTVGAGQPLYSRTLLTELVNVYELQWDLNPLTGEYRRFIEERSDASIVDIGVRRRDQGPATFSLHTPWEANTTFTVAPVLSGIGQFYAGRQALAATRFAFDTAWIAHGLDRGSLIRIAYPVTATSFRNVVAEVESIEVSPLDGERFSITARSLTKPQKGLEPNYTWVDVFDDLTDAWTTEIVQEFDSWSDYWSTP